MALTPSSKTFFNRKRTLNSISSIYFNFCKKQNIFLITHRKSLMKINIETYVGVSQYPKNWPNTPTRNPIKGRNQSDTKLLWRKVRKARHWHLHCIKRIQPMVTEAHILKPKRDIINININFLYKY